MKMIQLFRMCSSFAAYFLMSGALSFASSAGIGPDFKGPIGLQLYSLREQFKKDVPGTLDEVKGFGIKYAELAGTYNLAPEQFKSGIGQARHQGHQCPLPVRAVPR